MACRRRRHADPRGRCVPSSVDHLSFKYMMCKVESSTDSESEISPRWSDTSTMGCVSSAAESDSVPRSLPLLPRPSCRVPAHSLFLDPYDGSSEDSDASMDVQSRRGSRPPAKLSWCRGRRAHPDLHQLLQPSPVLLKTSTLDLNSNGPFHGACMELSGAGPGSGSSGLSPMGGSPSPYRIHKRKLLPGDQAQSKRQCVESMEVDQRAHPNT
ncbi:unnamed protein product [Knipowitschia caucasica]